MLSEVYALSRTHPIENVLKIKHFRSRTIKKFTARA